MPRKPRLFLQNMPTHIVQRGHDRKTVFVQRADYEYYLSNLLEGKTKLSIDVYAYCLMTNHVHLILAPKQDPNNVSKLLQLLAGRQTRYVNKLEQRTGTLWEGRFDSSPIDTDEYLLACYRYVDLNPVRAMIVDKPEGYEWSSYRCHASLSESALLDESASYRLLGRSVKVRSHQYRAFVALGTTGTELTLIRAAIQRNQLTGTEKFEAEIVRRTGRRIRTRARGNPRPRRGKPFKGV